jgi:hydroxypyruvate reductase
MSRAILEIRYDKRPKLFKPPFAYLLGGEITVQVGKATGIGGRNQEFALASAPYIREDPRGKKNADLLKNVVIASVDSDGTDGPSLDAGGIVDGWTFDRIEEQGIDLAAELENHNSNYVMRKLGDAIYTGARGTNIQDLRIVYISN